MVSRLQINNDIIEETEDTHIMNKNENLIKLLELANHYPSPHNGQPIRIKVLEQNTLQLYFEKDRGLQAAEVSYLFSFVTMGVFITHLSLCAEALGHEFSATLQLPFVEDLKGTGTVVFAKCQIKYSSQKTNDELLKTITFRQTSRKKYYAGIDDEVSDHTIDIATSKHMQLYKMSSEDAHQAVWFNQRAVFDDMFDDPVRRELNHWLRYSKREKEEKKDGLAYDCMELNGRAMKFIVNHYKLLHAPVISHMLKEYYLRTMSDNSDVYYLLTPFSNEQEAFNVGTAVMEIWGAVAAKGYYLHPFGTIMSNKAAHDDFLKLAKIDHEDTHKNFLVFIYRSGKSEVPHSSLRLPINEHLIME